MSTRVTSQGLVDPLVPMAVGGYEYEGDITGTGRLTCTHGISRI